MYLSDLQIWNFRKYGKKTIDGEILPGLHISFSKNLNLLVGENDSGKTTIIDAIKYVLFTRSFEYIRLSIDDFHLPCGCENENCRAKELKIKCIFKGFSDNEAKNFLEWLSVDKKGYWLSIFLSAKLNGREINIIWRAGEGEGSQIDSKARDLLRVTYLKPLRDAENELSPRRGSRISQILDSHEAFAEKDDHKLVEIINEANDDIQGFFNEGIPEENPGIRLHNEIDMYLSEFSDRNSPLISRFSVSRTGLRNILEKLQLEVFEEVFDSCEITTELGLGSHNLLFIAAELILLKKIDYSGLRLGLIEELEAHLHPQAQLRLIDYLQRESKDSDIQLILTTHSPILASKIKLNNLIICKKKGVFPMGDSFTKLERGDYSFLERFLNSTKANMFFAKGIILVEGDAENILIPTLARIIGYPLSNFGISIVNIGSTAFLRYSRIYMRKNDEKMGIPVSIITDLDLKPNVTIDGEETLVNYSEEDIQQKIKNKSKYFGGKEISVFVSPKWTLEYVIASSENFRSLLLKSIFYAQKEMNSNKYMITKEKKEELTRDLAEFDAWISMNNPSKEQIAYKIYYDELLKKNVSKAIVAQWFSHFLWEEKKQYKSLLESDQCFKYLIDAIKYSAGDEFHDSKNH